MKLSLRCWLTWLTFATASAAHGASTMPLLSADGKGWSLPIPTLLLLASVTLLPTLLLMMSSFTRIIIVLLLLRQGLGAGNLPPTQVLVGLALFLSFFVMGPTLDKLYSDTYVPLQNKKITLGEAWQRAQPPLKEFMLRYTRAAEVRLLSQAATLPAPAREADISMRVLIPAFVLSELKTAFQMGVVLLIPLVIIDLLVAAVLTALGLVMLPPTLVSLPIKLLLFVLVDGWNLLVGSLMQSFAT